MIQIEYFPMAPSDNRLHRTGAKSFIRYKSGEYKAFENEVKVFAYQHAKLLKEARVLVKNMLRPSITYDLFFAPNRLYTKKKTLKRLDTSNFIKGTQDAICGVLELDDSIFWEVIARRMIAPSEKEFCHIMILDLGALPRRSENPELKT